MPDTQTDAFLWGYDSKEIGLHFFRFDRLEHGCTPSDVLRDTYQIK